ncbi:n-acetylglutamate synthase [Flavicella sp.]|uniref:n-acetylglutamate synthase n=1 Tax=Flavicella sp. TaxID=2957742 RepID=UPI002620FE25|nr:n-acetylglutamate synthase [Flavicella sp.]MDG1806099.1 n-acetylglutamate synthase [Flavicella sp.]MDG2279812.1 n-acetylglutamate synthase [Flavicella sp.]
MNYNDKKFKAVENSQHGETSEKTVFHYKQIGTFLTATYTGGVIVKGQILGSVAKDGSIKMCYHQINSVGELRSGICESKPEILSNGKIRLHESWQWTTGGGEKGTSIVEEL